MAGKYRKKLIGYIEHKKQLDEKEISSFIEENRNNNTIKKTKTDLNVWTWWTQA